MHSHLRTNHSLADWAEHSEHELAMRYGPRESYDVTFDQLDEYEQLDRRHYFDFSGDSAFPLDALREPHHARVVTDSSLTARALVPTPSSREN